MREKRNTTVNKIDKLFIQSASLFVLPASVSKLNVLTWIQHIDLVCVWK